MATRERDPRIQDLYDRHVHVYSFSKLCTINDCQYDAYLSYVKHDRGIDNIYSITGQKIHDAIESIIDGKADTPSLSKALHDELDDMDMIGVDFPRDFKGGTAIRDKWIANMNYFCDHYEKPIGDFKTEQLLILNVSEQRALIGYADVIQYYPDGQVDICDLKTQSNYSTKDLPEHGRQLVIYAMAMEQAGYKVNKVYWKMLKYVQIKYRGKARAGAKTDTDIVKVCDCSKIYDTIHNVVEIRLEAAGVTGVDAEILMDQFRKTNTLDGFPEEVRKQFTIETYDREYPVTNETRSECMDFINRTADKFEALDKQIEWEPIVIDKTNLFKCQNLCGHRKMCKALRDYMDKKSFMVSTDDELF